MLADMLISLKESRALLHDTADAAGDGFPDICAAAQAEVFASETAQKVTQDALQIHGSMGYSHDLPMERLTRDAHTLTSPVAPCKSCARRWPVPYLASRRRKTGWLCKFARQSDGVNSFHFSE